MWNRADKLKGRGKEVVGVLTDNKKLEREGKLDQRSADANSKFDDVEEKAKEMGGHLFEVLRAR